MAPESFTSADARQVGEAVPKNRRMLSLPARPERFAEGRYSEMAHVSAP